MGAVWPGGLQSVRTTAVGSPWTKADIVLVLGWGQILLVALVAVLPTETARVWIFMQPFVMMGAAMQIGKWPTRERVVYYAAQWLVLAAVAQNMNFLD